MRAPRSISASRPPSRAPTIRNASYGPQPSAWGTRWSRSIATTASAAARARTKRPQFDRLHLDATRRHFDLVMCWNVDRLGRSLQHLCAFLSELHALRIDLYLHQQGLDTTTPAGKAMF